MSARPILHVVDGTGLVHRSFFAVRGLATRAGQPTGAVYGFINTIRALSAIEEPTHFLVTFDVSGSTAREQAFPEYKANRPKMDDDLASQLPLIDRACDALRLPVVSAHGYEADDVIATLARQATERDFDVVIITSDKDMLQLVSDRVSVLAPGRDGKPEKRYDRDGVIDKMGVPPERVVDLLALVGDAVDNVPGVPGIGEKGARELLQQFGSLDELLTRAGEVKRAAYRQGLIDHADKAHLSRRLVTLDVHVPVSFNPKASLIAGPDREAAYQLFKELEFSAFAREMAPQATAFSFTHHVVPDAGALEGLIAAARKTGEIAFSLSVSADRPMDAQISGIALACGDDAAFLAVSEGLPENVRSLLEDSKVKKWTTWSRRDFVVLGETGVGLGGRILDASLAAYVLSPGRRGSNVREIAIEEIGLPENADLPNEEGTQVSLLADHDAERHAREAAVLVRLAPKLKSRLESDGLMDLFTDLEMPLASILAEMERAGVLVDGKALKTLSAEIGPEVEQLAQRIYALAGKTFNILSPVQLREILFEEMGLESGRKTQKTKSLSTADDVLEDLAKEHEFPRLILEYRGITKLRSTYVDALPEMINKRTGRIHASFRQNVAATGRLSATDPNLQNIPIRTALGRRVREAFIAPPGHLLLSADYSQIELRILAHLSEDPTLIETFRRGEDVHDRTSLEIFGPFSPLPKGEQRRRSKMVNYALLYGKTAFTLAHDIGISRKEADAFIRAYFDRYPKVRGFIDASIEEARKTGMVRTMMGRLRRLPDIQAKNVPARLESERQAVNTRVQGSAADLIKKAMVDLDHS
ncbi:MAG: DNA polymerase I, partial [Vicinamibacteria bacterium]|nr:DNA polymerase I [Vicinamibacteria bacterium]